MSKSYINDIYKDEIRCGFLVTTDRKKIWQKSIEILMLIDKICKKHNIQYFADAGTLLGAVRHGGFIPWDDDIDLIMPRPDYEHFKSIIEQELPAGFFYKNLYNDNRIFYYSKVMDENTSSIIPNQEKELHRGMFVDIFPLDISAGQDALSNRIVRIADELWVLLTDYHQLIERIQDNSYTPAMSINTINTMLGLSKKERFAEYEKFLLRNYNKGEYVHQHVYKRVKNLPSIKRSAFDYAVLLPFEGIMIPAPVGYEEVLSSYYGDWRTPVRGTSWHEGAVMSVDIPYKKMLEEVDF